MMDWINVKDKLPTKEEKHLTIKRGIMGNYFITTSYFAKNLEAVDEYDFQGDNRSGWYHYDSEWGHIEDEVLYWLPLPKLPKELENL